MTVEISKGMVGGGGEAVRRPGETAVAGGRLAGLPWLVADIGGTNARFGWVDGDGRQVQHVRKLPTAGYPQPADAVHAYLHQLAPLLGPAFRPPVRAAFAVATAIAGDEVAFTNSHWRFSRSALRAELGLQALLVLNDFEALALSLPRLGADQLRAHGALPQPRGTMAVIGPGTGLGVGGVTQTPQGWVALPGEGGHATLAATDDFESALLQHARREFTHVSAERLLSGIGLPVLYRAVAATLGEAAADLSAEAIVEHGMAGDDAVCDRTLEVFCALLGSFAGSVALTLGARGGVYIGGGIVPRLGAWFAGSPFRARFENKGRFSPFTAQLATRVITAPYPALAGAAALLGKHLSGVTA